MEASYSSVARAAPQRAGSLRQGSVAASTTPPSTSAARYHQDPYQSGLVSDNYVFGKRIERKPSTLLKGGTGHQLAVKVATDADFIVPPSSLNIARQPARRAGSFIKAAPIRETVVNQESVKKTLDLQPADVKQCTELIAPVYSSFPVAKGAGWGKRPAVKASAFKPFVGDAAVKRGESTEFTTEVRSSIRLTGPAPKMVPPSAPPLLAQTLRSDLSSERSRSSGDIRSLNATRCSATDRTGGWLKRTEDTPGPGSYFVP